MLTEKVDVRSYRFSKEIERIVEQNIKSIPWEGEEVDKYGLIEDIIAMLESKEYSLLKHTKGEKKYRSA